MYSAKTLCAHSCFYYKHLFSAVVGYSFIFYFILFRLVKNWHVNNCENIVKFLCQYNNINVSLHQYLKGKKNTNRLLKKYINKKNFRHCNYSASWINKRVEQMKKKNLWKYFILFRPVKILWKYYFISTCKKLTRQ